MVAPGPLCATELDPKQAQIQETKRATAANGEISVMNLPENTDSVEQRQILDSLPVFVFLERAGIIVFANTEARQSLGLSAGEWVPRPIEEVLWGLLPGTAEPQTQLAATRTGNPFHATMPAGSGRLMPVEGTYSLVTPESRDAVIVAHPALHERAPKSRLMEDVLASIPEAVAIEHGNHILYTNPAFAAMFGYSNDEAAGKSLRNLIVPQARQNEHARLLKTVAEKGQVNVETVRTDKSGEAVQVSMQIAPLRVSGEHAGYVFSFRDSGEQKLAEARRQHGAMRDALTGLPNRALFMDRLTQALQRRARYPEKTCGVLYMNVDRFNEFNDTLGQAAVDDLLKSISKRLTAVLRSGDTAAHFGGDKFAILAENILGVGDLVLVAARLLGEMQRPFEISGLSLESGASIGAVMPATGSVSADLLIRDAEAALFRARQKGAGRVEIFDQQMQSASPAPKNASKSFTP